MIRATKQNWQRRLKDQGRLETGRSTANPIPDDLSEKEGQYLSAVDTPHIRRHK